MKNTKTVITADYNPDFKRLNNGGEDVTAVYNSEVDKTAYHVSDDYLKSLALGRTICLYPDCPSGDDGEVVGVVVSESPVYEVEIFRGQEVVEVGEYEYRIEVKSRTTATLIGYMEAVRLEKPVRHSPYSPGWISVKNRFRKIA